VANRRSYGVGWRLFSFVLLALSVSLRSTFQRSRGIIVKRLAPFSLERQVPSFVAHSRSCLAHDARCTRYGRSRAFTLPVHSVHSTRALHLLLFTHVRSLNDSLVALVQYVHFIHYLFTRCTRSTRPLRSLLRSSSLRASSWPGGHPQGPSCSRPSLQSY
jgi:hypothetical protein